MQRKAGGDALDKCKTCLQRRMLLVYCFEQFVNDFEQACNMARAWGLDDHQHA